MADPAGLDAIARMRTTLALNEGCPPCHHCGDPVIEDPPGHWSHYVGTDSLLIRCDPDKSGQPYGLDATPPEVSP